MSENKWGIDLSKEHNCQCPRCARNGRDRSQNNLKVYGEDKGAFCWSCNFTIPSATHKLEMGWDTDDEEEIEEVTTAEKITEDQIAKIKSYTSDKGKNTRDIPDDVYKYYGVLHKMSEESGEPVAQYYPITENYVGTAYKVRELPKKFSVIGKSHSASDLFGQWRFKNSSGKYLVITSGEIDCLSAFTMLENYRKGRSSDFEPVPCVSGTVGEKGSAKQIQNQYEWINKFSRVVYFPDQDAAGQEAMHKIAKVVPKGKLFIASLPHKDVNEMLQKGKEKQFISAFYDAKAYSPAGIVGSEDLYSQMVERSLIEKVSLPPFLEKLNLMLAGGLPLGYIVNLAAGSSTGKTTFLTEIVLHLIKTSPYRVGVVSLEASMGEYAENLLSREMGVKLTNIYDRDTRISTYASDNVKEAAQKLFIREDGSPAFHLVDDNGDYENIQGKIEEMIISLGVRVVLIDPTSDLFAGMALADVELHMAWQKKIVKQYNCLLINVVHLRKTGQGQKGYSNGGMPDEESISGSGNQYKSAGVNILLSRDKMSEDKIIQNTTQVWVSKNRAQGRTGLACEVMYDDDSHTLMEKDAWLEKFPAEF